MNTNEKEKTKALMQAIRHIAYLEGMMEVKYNTAPNSELRHFYAELKEPCEDMCILLQARLDSIATTTTDREELFPNG